MRFLLAIFAIWFAIVISDQAHSQSNGTIREKVWLSRTCTDSKWYATESDDQSVTMTCDLPAE